MSGAFSTAARAAWVVVSAIVAVTDVAAGPSLPLDEILSGYVRARGGLGALNATRSMRASGTMTLGSSAPVPFRLEVKRPRSIRLEYTSGEVHVVRAYDGRKGFVLVERGGKGTPRPMTADEERYAAQQADLAGPLVTPKMKGNEVELAGEETLDGRRAYVLRVTPKGETPRTIWLDAETLLDTKEEGTRRAGGTDVAYVTRTADWRKVGRLAVPFRVETGLASGGERQVMVFETVELDVALPDARFEPPAAASAP